MMMIDNNGILVKDMLGLDNAGEAGGVDQKLVEVGERGTLDDDPGR